MIKKEDIFEYIPIMQNEIIHSDFISNEYFQKYKNLAASIKDYIKIDAAEVYNDDEDDRYFKIVKKKNKYFYFEQKNGDDERIQIERITKCKTVRWWCKPTIFLTSNIFDHIKDKIEI